jgi:hypothetical protein
MQQQQHLHRGIRQGHIQVTKFQEYTRLDREIRETRLPDQQPRIYLGTGLGLLIVSSGSGRHLIEEVLRVDRLAENLPAMPVP